MQARQRRRTARTNLIYDIEDAIERERDGADGEALLADLCERLDDPDLPIAETLATIYRDLGLAAPLNLYPGERLTPQDVADLCTRAARLSSGQPPTHPAAQPISHPPPQSAWPGTGPPPA